VNPEQLSDVYEIQLLKARYLRYMDTRQWEAFRDLFTDDLRYTIENARFPHESAAPAFTSADALVAYLSASQPDKITVHQGHMPEIEFVDENTATGVWAMFGWTDEPGRGFASQSYGHYHERYVRCPDGKWRIASVHLTRLRLNNVTPLPSEPLYVLDATALTAVADLQAKS
jgi:hypothetical protein